MLRTTTAFILLCALWCGVLSQTPAPTSTPANSDDKDVEKQAVELLRETVSDVDRLRTAENRISFSSELASLMWFHDQKEAREMYGRTIADFKQLLNGLAADLAAPGDPDDMGVAGLFGPGGSKAERKLRIAAAVRQQIALSLAEHEPDLAFGFFEETGALLPPSERSTTGDVYFESQLLRQIAKADPGKGVEYGKKTLKTGVSYQQMQLLRSIYSKDADKGADFAQAILEKVKEPDSKTPPYILSELLQLGSTTYEQSQKASGKKPVYSRDDLRDLADVMARRALDSGSDESLYTAMSSLALIEKYSPGRGAQITARIKAAEARSRSSRGMSANAMNSAVNAPMYAANAASTMSNANGNYTVPPEYREAEQRQKRQEKLMQDISGIGAKQMPKEERDKAVEQALRLSLSIAGVPAKISALTTLASQVARVGDKQLATEIMADAERMLPKQQKNYQDFLLTWIVISGYAEADPQMAFPMLDSSISRANETLAALVKVGEFIDVNDEMVQDGEVQIGAFGGSMLRGITAELGTIVTTPTIRNLARADFKRTAQAANEFDRPEARVLAKMLILRAVLDKSTPEKTDLNVDEEGPVD